MSSTNGFMKNLLLQKNWFVNLVIVISLFDIQNGSHLLKKLGVFTPNVCVL